MSGTTISSTVTHAVTLGTNGDVSPLLITDTGAISLTSSAFAALAIDDPNVSATVTNKGLIAGYSGTQPGHYRAGGEGIYLHTQTTIVNQGVIRGGNGHGYYAYSYNGTYPKAGFGGVGILAFGSNSVIVDSGKIYGGSAYDLGGGPGVGGTGIIEGAVSQQVTHLTIEVTRSGLVAGGYGGGGGVNLHSGTTLENAGTVAGGELGGTAAYVTGGTVLNRGTIVGGAGGPRSAYNPQPVGGYGLIMRTYVSTHGERAPASGVNTGFIAGGAGGGYSGGTGVYLTESVFANHGTITGGASGADGAQGFGRGGEGVRMNSANISNFGLIEGGTGGGAGGGLAIGADDGVIWNSGTIAGSGSGAGIVADGNVNKGGAQPTREPIVIVNTGLIEAGSAYKGTGFFGQGDGVYLLNGGTLINSGTITGAPGRDAVSFINDYGNYANTLVIKNGAVFNGDVAANPANPDTLELAGTSPTALTGIGTQFTGFDNIEFAKGARWTISGDKAGLASGEKITGFASGDGITLTDAGANSGTVTVATAGVVTIDAGGVISKLHIAGATAGETNFTFSHYTLTESAPPAMSFLFAPAAPADPHPLSALDPLQHFVPVLATHAFTHVGLTETPMFGVSLDRLFTPQIRAVPIVTLHA